MKLNAGETHYKSKRLHLYPYFRRKTVQGSWPFAPRERRCARAPVARMQGQHRWEKQVFRAPASEASSNRALPLSLKAV